MKNKIANDGNKKSWKILFFSISAITILLLILIFYFFRHNYFKYSIKPFQPFQVEEKPIEPDYNNSNSWLLILQNKELVPVFFIHPTTYYNGKSGWNADIKQGKPIERLETNIIPNYIAPFAKNGSIWAPKYRQASLYSLLSFNIDTKDSLNLAYGDIALAFDKFKADIGDKHFIIVAYGQGSLHGMRLISEKIAKAKNETKLIAAYLINQAVPKSLFDIKMFGNISYCENSTSINCIVSYNIIDSNDKDNLKVFKNRAAYWNENRIYAPLNRQEIICYNPVASKLNSQTDSIQNPGSVNATNFSLDTDPPLFIGEASAKCEDGLLKTNPNRIKSLRPLLLELGNFYKTSNYNLFYKSLEIDFNSRIEEFSKQNK